MSQRFAKDDDPTEILEFTFVEPSGKITKSSIKAALKPPYPVKYYVNAVLTIVGLTVFLLWNFGFIPGTKLGFFCNDPLFSYKYTGDTITPAILGVGINVIFFGVYFVVERIRQTSCRDVFTVASLFEHYVYLKQFVIGIIMVGGATEIAKTIVGEHRPHFFDTCWPDTNLNCTNGTYIYDFTCTNKNFTIFNITDMSRSFPSGHSSLSWFVALYCAYIVHSRLPVHKSGTSVKILLFAICMTFSMLCSLTRITDRRHHWWDVLIGTVIGALGAAYVIRMTHIQVTMLRRKIVLDDKEEVPERIEISN